MERPPVRISVIIPCYNEEESMRPLVLEVRETLEPLGMPYEIVITDDGSTDRSWQVLADLAREFPNVRAQRFQRNCGQSIALAAGLRAGRGEILVTMDGDLQSDAREIPKLLDALKGCDCANGSRVESRRKGDGPLRVISSKIANRIRNALTGEEFTDSACNFRAMRRQCIEGIWFFKGSHRFLSTLIKMDGFRVAEVPVTQRLRKFGTAKYGLWNRVFRAARDLIGVRWMKSRHVRYEIIDRVGPGGA